MIMSRILKNRSGGCDLVRKSARLICRVREGVVLVVHWTVYSRPVLPVTDAHLCVVSAHPVCCCALYELSREQELWLPPRTPRSSSNPRNTTFTLDIGQNARDQAPARVDRCPVNERTDGNCAAGAHGNCINDPVCSSHISF